jgi:hypothetical protein
VREQRFPQATKFRAELQSLSFGDGTGYFGTEIYPPANKRQPGPTEGREQAQKAPPKSQERSRGRPRTQTKSSLTFAKPTFLSANFLSSERSSNAPATVEVQPVTSCLFPQCVTVTPSSAYVCYDNLQRDACKIQNRPNPDPNGVCRELVYDAITCTAGTVDYPCPTITLYECGFGPSPTPSPSASPSPQPCQYCTDPNALRPADCSDPAHPKCNPFLEYEEFGCCYRQTCERVGLPAPSGGPPPCPSGYFRSSIAFQPFPLCDYLPCIPRPQAPPPCSPEFNGGATNSCECNPDDPNCVSPVLVDISGNGFKLTDAAGGVDFDIRRNGSPLRVAWTKPNSDDAWLAMDLNGNGTIDNGQELFGNFTPQPVPPTGQERNGFLALAEYDKQDNGGNGDGLITPNDRVFTWLRLWQDLNHNGFSEAAELFSLQAIGLKRIELDYKLSKAKDEYGNRFRYRAKVTDEHGAQLGRWAWDVFLVSAP